MFSSILFVLALAVAVRAKNIPIEVGNGGINFKPNSTTADVGDVLEFHFYPTFAPHSVAEGILDSPCMPASNAFFSDYINGTSSGNETFSITVTSTHPIWYYCSAHRHCQGGMVGVVNPPSNVTVEMYAAAAKSASSNVAPGSTMVSGSYTTMPASMTTGTSSTTYSSSSMRTTGTSSKATGTSAGAATRSSTSTGASAKKTTGVMGMMAAGGLVALMV